MHWASKSIEGLNTKRSIFWSWPALTILVLSWIIGASNAAGLQTTSADVVVHGGTSAGVVSAVQSARMGKTEVLIEPGKHLGGLTSVALGATDIGNKGAISMLPGNDLYSTNSIFL